MAGFITASRAAAALCVLGLCIAVASTTAGATEHYWPEAPAVTCGEIVIDPTTWIKVAFVGTINGQPFSESAFYNSDGSHNAHVDISALTGNKDNLHIVVTASSNFGFGAVTSRTADVTLNCGSIVTEGSTTSSTGDPGGTSTTAKGAGSEGVATETAAGGLLPFTGAAAMPLTFFGCVILATGIVATRARTRRRRLLRRPSRGTSDYD